MSEYVKKQALLEWLNKKCPTAWETMQAIKSGAFDAEPDGEVQRLRAALGHIHAIAQSELDELQYESQRKTWEKILLTAEEALKGDENA
jgi:hypothetical protein